MSSDPEDEERPLDASHLDDDEDELAGRVTRPTKKTPAKPNKTKARQSRPTNTARKSAAAPNRRSAAAGKSAVRTYGRAAAAANKENEAYQSSDEEDTTDLPEVSMDDVLQSKELEAARRQFAEIDEYVLEVEDMSNEDVHRSSSQLWR